MNNDSTLFRVTGVVEDAPRVSHFMYDYIISYSTDPQSRTPIWLNNYMHTYILVRPGADQAQLDTKINEVVIERIRDQLMQFMGVSRKNSWKPEGGTEFSPSHC